MARKYESGVDLIKKRIREKFAEYSGLNSKVNQMVNNLPSKLRDLLGIKTQRRHPGFEIGVNSVASSNMLVDQKIKMLDLIEHNVDALLIAEKKREGNVKLVVAAFDGVYGEHDRVAAAVKRLHRIIAESINTVERSIDKLPEEMEDLKKKIREGPIGEQIRSTQEFLTNLVEKIKGKAGK